MKLGGRLQTSITIVAASIALLAATVPTAANAAPQGRGLSPSNPWKAQTPGHKGDWFTVGKDRLKFGPTLIGDDAWKVVGGDRLVEKPAPGWTLLVGTVTYKRTNGGLKHLWGYMDVKFRGGNGKVYTGADTIKQGGECPYSLELTDKTGDPSVDFTIPQNNRKDPQFYPCVVVPTKAVKGGAWLVDSRDPFTRPRLQYAQVATTRTPTFPPGLTPMNPYRAQTPTQAGDWFDIPFYDGAYKVMLGPTVTGEAAWDRLKDAPLAQHPAAGYSAVVATGWLDNPTAKSTAPFLNTLGPFFVGNDGVVYRGSDELFPGGRCPLLPTSLFGQSVEPQSRFEFSACAVVPDSAVAGGVWQMGPFNPFVIPQHNYIQATE